MKFTINISHSQLIKIIRLLKHISVDQDIASLLNCGRGVLYLARLACPGIASGYLCNVHFSNLYSVDHTNDQCEIILSDLISGCILTLRESFYVPVIQICLHVEPSV